MQGNYLMDTPGNPGGVRTGALYDQYLTSKVVTFGFEVLTCGQAIYCVQTKEQALLNPGDCGAGTYTASSCSSTKCFGYYWCNATQPLYSRKNQACYAPDSCPSGFAQVSENTCQSKK